MVIIPFLCGFEPIVLDLNENCVATLLIGNLPISKIQSDLEISKISLYSPLKCVFRLIDLKIFNFAQIDKILKNQTDLLTAFGKMTFPLM